MGSADRRFRHLPTAVDIAGANHVTFENNTITCFGAAGPDFEKRSDDLTLLGNYVYDGLVTGVQAVASTTTTSARSPAGRGRYAAAVAYSGT